MTSDLELQTPFRLSTSEIAHLWSEETERPASEIKDDLETWLVAFRSEETSSPLDDPDDQLLRFLGVWRVDRASLLTYCRSRGLEPPEFWFSDTTELEKSRLVSRQLFTWGAAFIVAFGVALVGWRYWSVGVEHQVIASENMQQTASRRIEKGLETQTSKEMVRKDQYRADGTSLESQSRAGTTAKIDMASRSETSWDRARHEGRKSGGLADEIGLDPSGAPRAATGRSLSSEMTQDKLSIGEREDLETAISIEAELALPPANPPQKEGISDSRSEQRGLWHDAKEIDLPDDILIYLTQKQLYAHDLYTGAITGTLTYSTRTAIRSYQNNHGINPDGEVSKELLRHLANRNLELLKHYADKPRHKETKAHSRSEMSISHANKVLGTTGGQALDETKGRSAKEDISSWVPESEHGALTRRDLIQRTQEMLSAVGFQAGPLDGILGQQTKSAIESYQWVYNLPADGLPTVGLLIHLEETIYLKRALRQLSLGEFREASRSFSRLIKLRPDDADVYFNRGLAFKKAGELERASEDFHAAIELNPAHTRAHFNLGNVHYQQGQYGTALGNYGRIVQVWLQGL